MTLDEVIKAFDECQNGGSCKNCPSSVMVDHDDYRCSEKHLDFAFYYLKELKRYVEGKRGETALFGTPLNENISVRSEGVYCNVCGARLDLERDDDDDE